MGIVFEAEDTHLLRTVALKVMRPELAASLANRTRFLNEARAAAALTSDHIVTVYQVGQDNDVPFLAMQLLHGEPLDVRISRERKLALIDALIIARQAAVGLACAHEKGLVHRDIKPGNLWLESDRPGGEFHRVRILDLGLVHGVGGPQLTASGAVVGTPHYMAPEQASGLPVDPRADLFSLGCVLYTMLSGELAFPGQSTMAVLMALATHSPPPLTTLNPSVTPELSALVSWMMAKAPEDRSSSAIEIIEQLDAILMSIPEETTRRVESRGRASGVIAHAPRREPISVRGLTVPDQASTKVGIPSVGGRTTLDTPSPAGIPTPAPGHNPTFPWPQTEASVESQHRWGRGQAVGVGVGLTAIAVALVVFGLLVSGRGEKPSASPAGSPEPIKVGVLHSQTGTMAVSESPVIDAALLAIDELNQAGGVLGRPLKAVIVDGKSDPEEFARQAEKLLTEENVAVIFGCWTSASRKAVRPVIERNSGILFYPVQYEGLEQSPRIVYLGPAPNQQLLPAIDFLTQVKGKKRLFLVGSDYVFPRTAHEIMKDHVKLMEKDGVRVVGEAFIPLGSPDVAEAIRRLKEAAPDAIVNTINGGTNVHFFRELRVAGMNADKVPTLSVSIAESEVEGLNPTTLAGDYLAASYFQTVERSQSREFVRNFQDRFGTGRVVSDPMAAAYTGVHIWAESVAEAGTIDPAAVLTAVRGRQFDGPRARVTIDPDTQHTWLPVRIGQIREDGQVTLLPEAGMESPIKPIPFPTTRTRTQWEQFLRSLQFGWNGKWQAPTP
jgi:urea transport system substrate-binding protein